MNYVLHIQIKKKNPHPVKLIFFKQNIFQPKNSLDAQLQEQFSFEKQKEEK